MDFERHKDPKKAVNIGIGLKSQAFKVVMIERFRDQSNSDYTIVSLNEPEILEVLDLWVSKDPKEWYYQRPENIFIEVRDMSVSVPTYYSTTLSAILGHWIIYADNYYYIPDVRKKLENEIRKT